MCCCWLFERCTSKSVMMRAIGKVKAQKHRIWQREFYYALQASIKVVYFQAFLQQCCLENPLEKDKHEEENCLYIYYGGQQVAAYFLLRTYFPHGSSFACLLLFRYLVLPSFLCNLCWHAKLRNWKLFQF